MISGKIVIAGVGCALADLLYNKVSFDSDNFKKYQTQMPGDGGLSPGELVFANELELFAVKPYQKILNEIIGNRKPDTFNVGGPSLVSLIHASQLLGIVNYEVKYYGIAGKDQTSENIFEILRRTPLNIKNYKNTSTRVTPFTDVFSDPEYDNGQGERTFVNNIGAAMDYSPDQLNNDFFDSNILCFGGTALVPQLHNNLTQILQKSKYGNCITVVNTVFDFQSEKTNPGKPWHLVDKYENYDLIDILIMDSVEAIRISGQNSIEEAAAYFVSTRVSSFIITNGARELYAYSSGRLFIRTELIKLPVSQKITNELQQKPIEKGDTTGCGDNFAGGIIASIAWQLKDREKGHLDLIEVISWGIASGGFSCFTIGGTYLERYPGEKKAAIQQIQIEYLNQIISK